MYIWAGISTKGATDIAIFEGNMNAKFHQDLLTGGLLPFVRDHYPHGQYRFMQDNDPKHTAKSTRRFFQQNQIPWWKTPPESPVKTFKCIMIITYCGGQAINKMTFERQE